MFRKTVSGILLFLLLVSTLTLAFNIKPVKAESGTIYIKADGSIDPPTAPIQRDGGIYTFTNNIYDSIVVQRSNITIDGAGYLLQGLGSGIGFYIFNVTHVTIKNTSIKRFGYGINLYCSSNNNITQNNVANNSYGIYLDGTTLGWGPKFAVYSNTLAGNIVANNSYGIYISESRDNVLFGNVVINNSYGLLFSGSPRNTLRNNIMVDNSYNFGVDVGLSGCECELQDIDLSNTVDGSPIYYWIDHENEAIPLDAGYVGLVNSFNITVKGLKLKNNFYGIQLYKSSNSQIINNTITNSFIGINLGSSTKNALEENNIVSNSYGIWLFESPSNTLSGNNLTNNREGIWLDYSSNSVLVSNTLINNRNYGIWLDYSSNSVLRNNNMSGNSANFGVSGWIDTWIQDVDASNTVDGKPIYYWINRQNIEVPLDAGYVALVNSYNITVKGLELRNNLEGISLFNTTNSRIMNNNVKDSMGGGISLYYYSNDNTITGNKITNDKYGVYIYGSNNTIISNNDIPSNSGGVYLSGSYNNTLYRNNVMNSSIGMYFYYSSNNNISENKITSCSTYGMYFDYSSQNTISNNYITENLNAISSSSVSYDTICENYIANNTRGIILGAFSNISGNNIESNTYGIYLSGTSNTVSGNNLTSNTYGIYVWAANNKIYHNNFIRNSRHVFIRSGINVWDDGYPSGGNYWSDYADVDLNNDGIWDHPYVIDVNNQDRYPLVNPWTPTPPIQEWLFDSDFQYNLDDNYGTVEGTGHLSGTATLSAGSLSIGGQITLNGPLPATVPEVYLIATDGQDKELAKQAVDLSGFSYWQTAANTYNFTGQIPNVIQPVNNGHYEASALITYNTTKYEFFVNTASLINSHYFPLTTPPLKFRIGDWVQTTANLNVREGPGLNYTIISTMPLGTIGQIVGGPVEADGFVWWEVNYAPGVRGWSAENWLELYPVLEQPPTCVVKLQKDGAEIHEIDVGEFFDIYVGGSIGVKGIKQVRFSSDDVREGYPTGEWTEWYDWDVSSGDWDTATKIKRWAFTTPGYKEVWAEVKDEKGYTAVGFATIFVPAPALPVLTSPLIITPVKDIYNVGDSLEAEFTIKNIGDVPITLDVLTVGGRLNGWLVVDFTHESITLQPEESYQYHGSLTLTQRGNYNFFVAYHIENPTSDEKRLLDENNWNTCVELGEGLTHNDRVKNIIVFAPEEVLQLREKIDREKNYLSQYQYPPNLLDENSFGSRLGKVWMSFRSFTSRMDLKEQYRQLYDTGRQYHQLAFKAVTDAEQSFDSGNMEDARAFLNQAYRYEILSAKSFAAAAELIDRNLESLETLVRYVAKGCELTVRYGIKIVYPAAAPLADAIYLGIDFGITTKLKGVDQAVKDALIDTVLQLIFFDKKFISLGDNTLLEYVNRVSEFVPLDTLLADKEFMQEFGIYLRVVLEERGWEAFAELITNAVANWLVSLADSITGEKKSPVDIRVFDSKGRVTGLINGVVKHEIPMSLYYNGTVTIFFPSDTYCFEVVGTDEGTYGLEITSVRAGNVTGFTATDIPTSSNTIHQYTIDFDALSRGEEGVTVQVDSDSDGIFEYTFTSDSELTRDEFIQQTTPTYTLTVTATVGGTTNPSTGMYTYTANSSVQVTAIPNADYVFDHWELDTVNVGSANPYTVLMDNNHTLKAVFTYSPPPPSLSASINPLSASILVGQSVTFTSTVSGRYTPYTYQWYLNGNPVSGATSNTWTFTPTTGGIYYVHLKVTDAEGNTAQSGTARIVVSTVPVGGYSIPIQLPTTAKPVTLHIALLTILTALFITIKRKTKRKH